MSDPIPFLSPRLRAQLDQFRSMNTGWLDGKGVQLSPQGLDWLNQQFEAYYPAHLPPPYFYPTAEGGVRAEWPLCGHEFSLEVSLELRRAEWHALNLVTDDVEARDLDLEQRDDWAWLAARLEEVIEVSVL